MTTEIVSDWETTGRSKVLEAMLDSSAVPVSGWRSFHHEGLDRRGRPLGVQWSPLDTGGVVGARYVGVSRPARIGIVRLRAVVTLTLTAVLVSVTVDCRGSARSPQVVPGSVVAVPSSLAPGTVASTTSSPATGPDPSYARRLQLAEALAMRYPGQVKAGLPLSQFGMWAGIIVQTRWQQSSGRERIPLWYRLNESLSVDPSSFASEFGAAATKDPTALCLASRTVLAEPTSPVAPRPVVSRFDACQAWMRYFVGVDEALPPATLQQLLWHAHTLALVEKLTEHRTELDQQGVTTDLERNFWASWFEIVFTLEALNYPSDGAGTLGPSDQLMPLCSPIGARGCELTAADLGPKLAFVTALASRPASIDRIFELYQLGHSNPAAVAPFELSDPTIASALTVYLAASRGS